MIFFLQPKFVMLLCHMTQFSDIGGFLFGSIFGKTPFVKSISPKKTWEGVIGALLTPVIINTCFYFIGHFSEGKYALQMPLLDYMFLGFVCAMLAIMGDLIESFIKRCSNVKDSGSILPGHGGMLDRIDSMTLTTPFLYWFALEFLDYTHSKDYNFNKVHIFQVFKF
jgi:phosphatidate cytidylyltransferase